MLIYTASVYLESIGARLNTFLLIETFLNYKAWPSNPKALDTPLV